MNIYSDNKAVMFSVGSTAAKEADDETNYSNDDDE